MNKLSALLLGIAATILPSALPAAIPTTSSDQHAYVAVGGSVWLVDILTGERGVVSGTDLMTFTVTGTGPSFLGATNERVSDVLIEDSTNLIVSAGSRLFRVNRADGTRTGINASALTYSGSSINDNIYAMEWLSPGVIVALVEGFGRSWILRIQLSDLSTTILSDSTQVATPKVGGGYGSDLHLDSASNELSYMDFSGRTLFRMSTVSPYTLTQVSTLDTPYAISVARLGANDYLLGKFDGSGRGFLRYNALTDTHTQLTISGGPGFPTLGEFDVFDNGIVLALDTDGGRLYRVNLATNTAVAVPNQTPFFGGFDYSSGSGLRLLNKAANVGVADWATY